MARIRNTAIGFVMAAGLLAGCSSGGSAKACAEFFESKINAVKASTPAEFASGLTEVSESFSSEPSQCKNVKDTEENRKIVVDGLTNALVAKAKEANFSETQIQAIKDGIASQADTLLKEK